MKELKISNYVPVPDTTRFFWFVDTALVSDRFYCDDDGTRNIGEPVYETMVFLADEEHDVICWSEMEDHLAITEEKARENQETMIEKWSKIGIDFYHNKVEEEANEGLCD